MESGRSENSGLQILQELAARAQDDPSLRERLQADPHTVLRDAGLEVPGEVRITVHENTEDELHLVLPREPHAVLDPDERSLHRLINGIHF
jgi:hypothetical protein